MAGDVRLFVGLPMALAPFCELTPTAHLCRLLPQSDFAVLPLQDDLQDALHRRYGTGDWPADQTIQLSTTDQAFAAECSTKAPIAYLEISMEAGESLQAAAVWQNGLPTIGPIALRMTAEGGRRPRSLWPINVALRTIGVACGDAADEGMALGLDGYSSNEDILARALPLQPRPDASR